MKKMIALVIGLSLLCTLCACNALHKEGDMLKELVEEPKDKDDVLNNEEAYPQNIAVVYAHRSNMPVPSANSKELTKVLLSATASYGSVTVIVSDGAPYAAASYEIKAPAKKLSPSKRKQIAQQQAAQIIAVLQNTQAKTPEADILGAITLASRSLSDVDGGKMLLVLDSGLSTCGALDFRQNLLRAESSTVIDYLEANNELPDLKGASVLWIGLGDVCAKQEKLSNTELLTLKNIWQDVLSACGASDIRFSQELPSTELPNESLPYVSPIRVVQAEPLQVENPLKNPLVMEESVLFQPDSTELIDPQAVRELLDPLIEYTHVHEDYRILLAGTTATAGTNDACVAFSLQRAEAVADLLVENGVAPERVICRGLGYENPYHIPDITDGRQNQNASKNRSVILFDASTEEAKTVINIF